VQFRLSTLFLLFVVLWSSLAVFGPGGIIVFALLVSLAIGIARSWSALLALLCVLVLFAFLLPAVQTAREAARRISCHGQMNRLLWHCTTTARVTVVSRLHTSPTRTAVPCTVWRVLILPFLECDPLYKQYNFNEPWDGPNNKKLLAARPRRYVCRATKTPMRKVQPKQATFAWSVPTRRGRARSRKRPPMLPR